MPECPDRDCREDLIKRSTAAARCANDKISKKALWSFVGSYGALILIFAVSLYAGQQDKADKEKVAKLSKQITEIKTQQRALTNSVDRLRNTMQKNQDKTDAKLDKIIERLLYRDSR